LTEGNPSETVLEIGKTISFIIGKGRFCVGYSHVTKDYFTMDSWKKRLPCPTSSLADFGNQCRACAAKDASSHCARCSGDSCSAHQSIREACERGESFVYLAVFGDRIKAGVSQGQRVEKRWIEQGADAARRVLKGNGREIRIYEKKIQDELGALKRVKADEKTSFTDSVSLERGLKKIEEFTEKIHKMLPPTARIDDTTKLLLPRYGLPKMKVRPIDVKIRDNVKVVGKILGTKGPILYLDNIGIIYSINIHALTGRKIVDDFDGSSSLQSGLSKYVH